MRSFFTSFIFTFLCITEVAIAYILQSHNRLPQAVKLHRIARWAFPLAYFSLLVLLLVIYWPARQGTTEITAQPPSAKGTGRHQTSRGLDLRTRSEHPLRHSKNYVALERLLGCRNLDKAGGSARGHRGFDFSSGNTRELGRRAIKSDIGGAGQIVSQNRHGPPDLAGGRGLFRRRDQVPQTS
jgi:hypothetical protein